MWKLLGSVVMGLQGPRRLAVLAAWGVASAGRLDVAGKAVAKRVASPPTSTGTGDSVMSTESAVVAKVKEKEADVDIPDACAESLPASTTLVPHAGLPVFGPTPKGTAPTPMPAATSPAS